MANRPDEDSAAADSAEVAAIAAGDHKAFERLIDREGHRLLRFSTGILGQIEEAEDVVQEAFLSLWNNASGWRPEARISTWLHTVCYNRSIDRLRRRRNLADESELDAIADSGPAADVALIRGESARLVAAAVERLPARQRAAVHLFHYQELSQDDGARVMGITVTAFESLLARGRRQIRMWITTGAGDE